MTVVAVLAAALAAVAGTGRGHAARRRLADLDLTPARRPDPTARAATGGAGTGVRSGPGAAVPVLARPVPRAAVAVLLGALTGLVVGGPAGIVLGVATAGGSHRLAGRLGPDDTDRLRALARDLPLGLDLVACALTAGAPLGPALELVAGRLPGPLGAEFAAVAASLRLGAAPAEAAARLVTCGPAFGAVGRAFARADESGSRLATQLSTIATAERAAAHGRAVAAARRVGVSAVAPLGLCFLPAFVLIGVVPIVVGAARHVLT